jgi:hypothetical protein
MTYGHMIIFKRILRTRSEGFGMNLAHDIGSNAVTGLKYGIFGL